MSKDPIDENRRHAFRFVDKLSRNMRSAVTAVHRTPSIIGVFVWVLWV